MVSRLVFSLMIIRMVGWPKMVVSFVELQELGTEVRWLVVVLRVYDENRLESGWLVVVCLD